MPRKKLPKLAHVCEKNSPLKFENFGIDPEKHGEFKEEILKTARATVKEFPDLLETIRNNLADCYPPQALSAFCCYGSAGFISTTGKQTDALPEIMQHHCELLQAILLTVPQDDWGGKPITPDAMEVLFNTMPKLSNTFFMQRILEGDTKLGDEEEQIARSLQERVRMHTHTVRNWGHFDQVVQISRELYSALDPKFLKSYGFSATDLIDTLFAVQAEAEERMSAHIALLRKVLSGRTAIKLVERYYRFVPSLVGSADEMLSGLPADITREQMAGMIMAHLDLRLIDTRLFTPEGLSDLTGKPNEVILAILSALSLEPGSLMDAKPEFLFLDNPIWERPVISLNNKYLVPLPQAAFSHIHRIMERLAREVGLETILREYRASFLESSVENLFRKALPDANFYPSFQWE
ncbi:hypothetical protein [uncultured Sneathiella sp.]|uniref:hypothetical protein n=1 Tax=uncultured Sneathiella sp. TaxID=879315 RepID=UPI0030ED5EC4|tara:strand:+ start:1975 stop:3198 length:1224 start_codon:yes stop_codon:yes gene_type:complete